MTNNNHNVKELDGVRIFHGDSTRQIDYKGNKANPELWYYEPSDYDGDVLWSLGYANYAEAYHAAGCSVREC